MNVTFKTKNHFTKFRKKINETLIKLTFQNYFLNLKEKDQKENKKSEIDILLFNPELHKAPFWYYDFENNKHIVAIPDIDMNNFDTDEVYGKEIYKMVKSIVHELGHAHFTEKNIKKISEILKEKNVPFDVINILEDLRIENLMSTHYLSNLPIFKWATNITNNKPEIEKINEYDDFWQVIFKLLKTQGLFTKDAYKNPIFCQIEPFIKQAIESKSTNDLIELSIEFYNYFKDYFKKDAQVFNKDLSKEQGNQQQQNNQQQQGNQQQKQNEKENFLTKEKIEAILKNAEKFNINFNINNNEKMFPAKIDEIDGPYNIEINELSNSKIFIPKNIKEIILSYDDLMKIKKIRNNLLKILIPKREKENYFSIEANEFDINKLIDFSIGDYDSKIALMEKQKESKKINLHLLVDISGSMYFFHKQIAIILYSFNKLTLLFPNIDINITFTKVNFTNLKSMYQTFKMPIKNSILNDIYKNPNDYLNGASEGFKESLKVLYKNQKTDLFLILSDLILSKNDEKELKKFMNIFGNKTYILYPDKKLPRINLNYVDSNKIITNDNLISLIKELVNKIRNPSYKKNNNLTFKVKR